MAARGTGPNDSFQEPQEKRKKGREEEEEEEERMVEERGERVKEEGRRWQRVAERGRGIGPLGCELSGSVLGSWEVRPRFSTS